MCVDMRYLYGIIYWKERMGTTRSLRRWDRGNPYVGGE